MGFSDTITLGLELGKTAYVTAYVRKENERLLMFGKENERPSRLGKENES